MTDAAATVRESVLADVRGDFAESASPTAGVDADESAVGESFFDFDALSDGDLVESYWVDRPFVHVAVLENPEAGSRRYHVLEPALDEFERYVRQDLAATIRETLADTSVPESGREEAFLDALDDVMASHAGGVPDGSLVKLRYYFERDFVGYGPIGPFVSDPAIEDLSCDGADAAAFVFHADHGNVETNRSWGADRLDDLVLRLAQRADRHLSASRPLLTTTLPDGSRVQLTLDSDVTPRGSNFTLRKFREEPFTPPELVDVGTFSVEQLAYLWLAIEHNRSVIFAGPTASGKTTSMNAASLFVPPDHKVVTIEETREIGLPHPDWVPTVTREADVASERPAVGTDDLLSEALHQRPDHVLVGELRTDPAVARTFFQAIGTGHEGFTTFHAESADDALRRLGHSPLSVPTELLADLDVVCVQQLRDEDGATVRRASALTEVRTPADPDADRPDLRPVFEYDPAAHAFEQVAPSAVLSDVAADRGWDADRLAEALRRRQRVLADLVDRGVTGYEAVVERLFRFARRPDAVLSEIDESAAADRPRIRVADDA